MTLAASTSVKPRVGFVGVGWIGRARMDAVSSLVEIGAVADPAVPGALGSIDELLERELDGVVIATPNAFHAEQAIAALRAGTAVFCQKPLGRNADEAQRVVDAARAADRLLGVDLCYRFTRAARAVKSCELRDVYAVEASFHNAYGPDRSWFYSRELAGGGCVLDLGIHLVDLVLWTLDRPQVVGVRSRLHYSDHDVEDYAIAQLDLDSGAVFSLACSWNLPAGRDCVIDCRFYGTSGGAAISNVDGSFYDLRAERLEGTTARTLVEPPDDWGGYAIRDWAERLAAGGGFDAEVERVVDVQRVVDAIYESGR